MFILYEKAYYFDLTLSFNLLFTMISIRSFLTLFKKGDNQFDFTSLPVGQEFFERHLPTYIKENFQKYKVVDKNVREKLKEIKWYRLSELEPEIINFVLNLSNKILLEEYKNNKSINIECKLEYIRTAYAIKFAKELFPTNIEKQSEYIHYLWWYRKTLEMYVEDDVRSKMVHFYLLSNEDKKKDSELLEIMHSYVYF